MSSTKYEYASDDPKYKAKYLQDVFRKQADKRIKRTMDALDAKAPHSFVGMQQYAYNLAIRLMKKMRIIDKNGKPLNKTLKEIDDIFDTYYNHFLDTEKKSQVNQFAQTIDEDRHLKRLTKESRK